MKHDGGLRADRDRSNSKGSLTRQIILAKAEQMFAEQGIAATPLRDIALAAGQKNNVAIQYHFGDREGLLRAIISYHAATSEKVRAEMMADLLIRGRPPQVHDLVRAFVVSLARHFDEGGYYLAFLARYIVERGGYAGLEGSVSASTITSFMSILYQLLPDHEKETLDERWMIVMTTTVHTLSRYQMAARNGRKTAPTHELLENLINFMAAGIESAPQQYTANDTPPPTPG